MIVAIRPAADRDAAAIAEIYAPFVESSVTSFEIEAPPAEEIRRRVHETTVAHPWLVCVCDDQVAGYAYATKHRVRAAYQWSVETSVYVHDSFRRAGVGRGLYTSLFAILAAQGFVNALAGITLPNARSVALHESMGFLPVGVYRTIGYKTGAWHDVGWWHLLLRSHPSEPRAPLVLEDVQRDPAWETMLSAGLRLIRVRYFNSLEYRRGSPQKATPSVLASSGYRTRLARARLMFNSKSRSGLDIFPSRITSESWNASIASDAC